MAHGFSVAVHDRFWTIDESGLAFVTVQLNDVRISERSEIVLATLVPPYCAYRGEKQVDCDGCFYDVVTDDPNSPRARFDVTPQPVNFAFTAPIGEFSTIRWSFFVSCAVPYLAADQFFPPENYWQSDSKRRFVRSHELRIPCDLLRIKIEFASQSIFFSAKGLVEQRMSEGSTRWKRVRVVETEHDARPPAKGRTATLSIQKPTVGHRYGIELNRDVSALGGNAALPVADHVRQICRNEQPGARGLLYALTESLRGALVNQWPCDRPLVRASATGFLWNTQEQMLEAAYGICPMKHFAARFKFGCGVAGHAFRFARCAGVNVSRHEGAETVGASLLYQNVSGLSQDWVVCIPVLAGPDGIPVGVVSFSGGAETETKCEADLYSLAQFPNSAASKTLFAALMHLLSAAFWDTLREAHAFGLSNQEQEEAADFVAQFRPPPVRSRAVGQPVADSASTPEASAKPAQPANDVREGTAETAAGGTHAQLNSIAPRETVSKSSRIRRVGFWRRLPVPERVAWIGVVVVVAPLLVTGAFRLMPGNSEATSQPPAVLTKAQAISLLKRGAEGLREFRERRERGESVPSLANENFSDLQLAGACFQGLIFGGSVMDGVNLDNAILNDADLAGVKLRVGSNGAATLRGAQLEKANLTNAEFDRTDFSGANLRSARGLVQQQLSRACGDSETRLPVGLSVPSCR